MSDGEKKKKFPWAAESQVLRTPQGFPPHAPSTEMLGARGSSSPSTLAAPLHPVRIGALGASGHRTELEVLQTEFEATDALTPAPLSIFQSFI